MCGDYCIEDFYSYLRFIMTMRSELKGRKVGGDRTLICSE